MPKPTEELRFERVHSDRKTEIWNVLSTKSGRNLGVISWYGPWKTYTFRPVDDTIWNYSCMKQIQEHISDRNIEHTRQAMVAREKLDNHP